MHKQNWHSQVAQLQIIGIIVALALIPHFGHAEGYVSKQPSWISCGGFGCADFPMGAGQTAQDACDAAAVYYAGNMVGFCSDGSKPSYRGVLSLFGAGEEYCTIEGTYCPGNGPPNTWVAEYQAYVFSLLSG